MKYNGRMNTAVKTRHLYNFEQAHFRGTRFVKSIPMKNLRKMTKRIWNAFGKNKELPKIIASKGTLYGGRYLSYNQFNDIHLIRNQRNVITLVHEITHALGFDDHNKRFVDMEFNILEQIFGAHRGELELTAELFGVDR